MEDLTYQFNDPYECSIDPSFFTMSNPILDDLGAINNIDINNEHTSMFQQNLTNLSINNNNLPHQNHHGVFQQEHGTNFNDHFPSPLFQQNHHGSDTNSDPFDYTTMSQENHHDSVSDSFFDGMPQQMHEDQQTQPVNQIPVLPNQTDAMTLDQWPPAPIPYFCSCCQVLREIIHANGVQFEKLEIHGRLGLITHAIHHQTPVNGNPPINQMIDFSMRNLDEIKKFLAQYCMDRILAGYFILQDPLSSYYETLCTGLDWIEDFNMEGLDNNNQNNSDEMVEQEQCENGTPTTSVDKKDLSEQRKRAGKLTLSDLCNHFHLPIEEASEKVDLCPTVLKKTCRKAGLTRWPHRKVKSLLKQIALLESEMERQDAATRAMTEKDISELKEEMIRHCGGLIPTAMYNIAAFLPPQHQQGR
ncbi:unnamed protein product [Lathyrus sativus]|nr:unnamed protein product [Lathyrus sativus]